MAIECIHGFEPGLCDICFPKVALTPKRSSVVRPPRATMSARAERGGQPTRSGSRSAPLSPNTARVYHLTHVRNLQQILESGQLRSWQNALAGASAYAVPGIPAIDLSSELTRELRATAEVRPGLSVSDCVPFFLSPNAGLWHELRSGAVESTRWSDAARAAASTDFIMLVTTIGALGEGALIADDDAAGTFTRFSAQADDRARLFSRLSAEQLLRAEVLAPETVELNRVQLIGVANDPMRERVRGMLAAVAAVVPVADATQLKVAVYPPWFQRE